MRIKYTLVGIVIGVLFASAAVALAGNLNPSVGPSEAGSQMYTLKQIYDRLDSGAAGAKMDTFTEPGSGPGGTMYTLNQIMAKAPVTHTNGATQTHVLTGKTFWGLHSSAWATQTGTAAAGSNVNGADGSKTFNIPDGFYSGKTATANDLNLQASNIVQGVDIFGVAGSAVAATGDATAGDVLTGKTFSNASATGIAGTMTDREGDNASTAQSWASEVSYFTAPQGHYDGDDRVSATDAQVRVLDADITAGNIKSGVTIFGVSGDSNVVNTSSGDAAAGDILQDKIAWVGGSEVTGNIETRTLSDSSTTVAAGYYAATTWLTDKINTKPENDDSDTDFTDSHRLA